jgi:hypothetical protein
MVGASAKRKHVSLGNEEIDGALDEDTYMEVRVGDSDDDWGDTVKGGSDSESENESEQQESDHEDSVQHVPNGFVPNGNVCPKFTFVGTNGVKVDIENETDILKYFLVIWTTPCGSLLQNKVTCMPDSFFAADPNLKPRLRVQDWVDTNINELKTFTAILLLQEILHKLENRLYF